MSDNTYPKKIVRDLKSQKLNFLIVALIFAFVLTLSNTSAPLNFAQGKMVTIEKGRTIKQTAEILKKENIIRSDTLFSLFVSLGGSNVVEGTYLFHTSENIFEVIDRITHGDYEIPIEKITFFEGVTSFEMAEKLKNRMPNFDVNTFIDLAQANEGYLFPDTYEFQQNVSAEEVFETMRDNFDQKIADLEEDIENSGRSLEEIIKVASIIEGEADKANMQQISNILWKRYDLDMPLQVDATFVYSIGKSTFDLTLDDLRDEENPYNSYEFKGLPPTPISNPGLDSINAALNQQETPYLFFLTGNDGIT